MKKVYTACVTLIAFVFFIAVPASGQITGIKTIPGDYASIGAAVADLNSSGVGPGGVTFNVAAGSVFTENIPTLNATGLSSTDQIIFQKSGAGANPRIVPSSGGTIASSTTIGGNGDGIFVINGGDYITIDGIDLQTNASFTGSAMYEYGYYLKKASATDASKSVIIRNCNITLNKAAIYSFGIYVSNISGTASVTVTNTGGRSEDIKLYSNTITNAYGGIQLRGYNHTASPYDFYDQNIEIGQDGGNTITNYGGATTTAYGVYTIYQNNVTIANNTINNTAGGGTASANTLYGIFLSTGTNASATIHHNTVSITGGGTTQSMYAINCGTGATGTSNVINIYNNTITNCAYPTATSGDLYLIYQSTTPHKVFIDNNTITNNTLTSSSGTMYSIYNSGAVVNETSISGNTVSGINKTGTGAFYGVYSSPAATSTNNIFQNTVNNNNVAGTTYYTYIGPGTVNNVYNNIVRDNTSSGTSHGMYVNGGTQNNIYRNNISGLMSSGATGIVYGLTIASGPILTKAYNNFISDLKAPAADATADVIRGINITSVTATSATNLWHNTIYLDATSTGVNFSTTGIYETYSATATSNSLTMQNNIIVNMSAPKGSGIASAFRRSAPTDLNNYNSASDKNLFYVGTPAANKLIYYDGVNSDQTLIAFQTRVSPREAGSVRELPPFINVATLPYNLHINTTIPTQVEGNGMAIPDVTEDFDSDPRNPGTPDLGADEFNGTPAVAMAMSSSTTTQITGNAYLGLPNQAILRIAITTTGSANPLTAEQFLVNANGTTALTDITNATVYYTAGSPVFSTTIPFASAAPVSGNFAITGSQTLAEGVNYFWLTYDVSGGAVNGNLLDAELVSSKINSVTYVPTVGAPAGNKIVVGPMAGNYNVGAGQVSPNFVTLTEAINDLNVRGMSASVTLTLVNSASTPYNEANGETFPIVANEVLGVSSTATITIKPGAGVSPVITGNIVNAIIRLDGADYVTIDGSNNGTNSRNLTISNSSTSTSSAVIWTQTGTGNNAAGNNTVKNCIVSGNASTTTLVGVGFGGSAISISSLGASNNNNTVLNNEVRSVQYGIFTQGTSAVAKNSGNVIQGNLINGLAPANVGKAGIFAGFEDGINISSNIISEVLGSADVAGITLGTITLTTTSPAGNEVTNATVSKNQIGKITSTGSSSAVGIYVAPSTSGSSTIDNNVITGVTSGSTSPDIAAGIYLAGGSGGATNVYFNSVSMSGTRPGSPSFPSFAFAVAGSTPMVDVQNNIFVNQQVTASAGKSYAYGLAYTSAVGNYVNLNSNNNLLYVSGTNGVLAKTGALTNTGGTDLTTLTAWNTETGKDVPGISLSVDPLFNSPTDLQPLLTSPVIGAGTAVGAITTDIIGTTRGNPPSIGAYETGADHTGPIITVTPLLNTSVTTARTLIASIVDPSGIGTGPNGLPVLYWKINTGAYASVTGTFVSGNNYSFTFGSGVATGDSISYFIAAQDVYGNVSVYPSTGASGLTNNPPAASVTPTAPLYYKIVQALSGIYTVGTGENFNNLTAIANLLNNLEAEIAGNVIFELTSNYNGTTGETLPINFNEFPSTNNTWTVTIRPAAGVTNRITSGDPGSGTGIAVINFNGGDRYVFDGRPGGVGISNEWTIRNTRTATTIGSVIRFVDDATYNVIRNLNIESQATSTTTGAIFFNTSTGTLGNSNNTISANHIRGITSLALSNGIYSSGTATALNSNNTIDANHIYNFDNVGISIAATGNGANWNITNNHLYNTTVSGSTQSAITISSATTINTLISGNYIGGNAPSATGTWTNSGNVALNAISITDGKVDILNNVIANLTSTNTGTTTRTRGISFTSDIDNSLIQGNTIYNLNSAGGQVGYTGGNQAAVGIHYFPGGYHNLSIVNNIIHDISITNTTALTTTSIAAGVMLTNMGGTFTGNKIYAITNRSTGITAGQPAVATGFFARFFSGTAANNFIEIGTGETDNVQYSGILIAGGAVGNTANMKYYHNTIVVGGTSTGTNNSYAFLRGDNTATTPLQTVDLRNNILVNLRSGGGSMNYAVGNQGSAADTYWTSDFNDLYSTDMSTIGLWNSSTLDLATWKSTSAGDAASFSVLPVFVSATDRHLVADQNCMLDGKATPIASVTTDFDGDARNATTPDIGADEFANTYVFTVNAPAAVCAPATVDLTAAAITAGTTSGTALSYWTNNTATSSLSNPNAVTTTGTYYIKAEKGNCIIVTPVLVTIDPVSVGGTLPANMSTCNGSAPADITLNGQTGNVVKWQRSTTSDFSAGVTDINVTTTTLNGATNVGPLTATTYIRAVVKSGTCTEANSSVVTISIDAATVAGSVNSNQSVCIGNTPSDITLTGNTGSVVKWQRSTTNDFSAGVSDVANTTTSLSGSVMGGLYQTTYFRAVVKNGVCNEVNAAPVAITVTALADNTVSLAGVAGGAQVCATYDVVYSTNYLNNCNLIATVVPSGTTPVNGVINSCTKIENSVPLAPVTNEPYVARHYNIIPVTNATTATSTITLYFLQSEFDAFNIARGFYPALPTNNADASGKANLRVSQFAGTSTVPGTTGGLQIDPSDVAIVFNGTRWEVTFDVTGSGSFFVHTGSFVLPVTGLDLKGEQVANVNKLTWATATETNNKGFDLQRSADGSNFSSIGFVASKAENGNSTSLLNYRFDDNRPISGSNYYRLKQVDKDGKFSYSNIVLLSRKVANITISSVYPNPAERELNVMIASPAAEKVTIIITDLTGKLVIQQATQLVMGENRQQLNVASLAAGTYVIKAVCANGCETTVHRFVKQ